MSPLRYQKQLRLQEARQLMLNESLDAGSAGGRVGYESPSQFSREYVGCLARRLSAMSRACGWLPCCAAIRVEAARSTARKGATPSIDPTVARVPMN